MKRNLLAVAAAVTAAMLYAQAPAFEVASIKRSAPKMGGWAVTNASLRIAGNRVTARGISLRALIQEAYEVNAYQVSGEPDWARQGPGAETYDLECKAESSEAPAAAQVHLLLQTLLATRFQLKLHRDTRELPVYELTVDKSGLKLKPVPKDAPPVDVKTGLSRTDMARLVKLLSLYVDRPLIDKTGLAGVYEYDLSWMGPDYDATREGISYLVPKNLGLRFEPRKSAVEMLVVDHVEHPSEN